MAASCKVCISPKSSEINSALLAGQRVSEVQRVFPDFTDSAIRRHFHNHLSKGLATKVASIPSLNVSDLTQRLIQIADDAQTVRNRAVAQNNGSATLRAIAAEIKVISELTQTLEVNSTDIKVFMEEANIMAAAVGAVASENPDFLQTLADEIRDKSPDMHSALIALKDPKEIT